METVKLLTQVDAAGTLHVAVPPHFANQQVEVVLVLRTIREILPAADQLPADFFARLDALDADDLVMRPPQLPLEVRDELE
jgi:hypothetical protein